MEHWVLIGVGFLVVYLGFKFLAGIVRMILLLGIIAAGVWGYAQYLK